MNISVLFIDDDKNTLAAIRRRLHNYPESWNFHFSSNGAEAINIINNNDFDVVVTDHVMKGITGLEILNYVEEEFPHIIRILFSSFSDDELSYNAIRSAHQLYTKPFSIDGLLEKVTRMINFKKKIGDRKVLGKITTIKTLPSLPEIYQEIQKELKNKDYSLKTVGEIIGRDIGMSSKILQLVNSSFFGLSKRITNPQQAVSLLGINTIKNLALSMQIFRHYSNENDLNVDYEKLWNHSIKVASLAKKFAMFMKLSKSILDDIFISGLLHDIGKLVLACEYKDDYPDIRTLRINNDKTRKEKEFGKIGVCHDAVAAYLLEMWAIPENVVDAVAGHHEYDDIAFEHSKEKTSLQIANYLANKQAGVLIDKEVDLNQQMINDKQLTDYVKEFAKSEEIEC